MHYNLTLRRIRATIVAVGSNRYYILWVWVCNLMYPAWNAHALYCHQWPVPIYNIFPYYPIFVPILVKKKDTDHKMRAFIFTTDFTEIFLILRRTERGMIKNINLYSCKVPAILLDFHETWIFFDIFERKNSQVSKFMEIRPMEAELFHTDRWTYRLTRRT